MVLKIQERLRFALLSIIVLAAWVLAPAAFAQDKQDEPSDSLVRLVKGSSVQLIEIIGRPYRKAIDATFLHNGTYLICDSALWNVEAKLIEAEGHVQVIQDETILTSDRLDYQIDESVAKFRGSVVQLQDKDRNTLRTRNLDYNTKDSTAVFFDGGSMRSHDGQVIESRKGTYDSKTKVFTFVESVNMFTDSVFIKTELLDYDTKVEYAHFRTDIDFWKDGNMLSSKLGWYDHMNEVFFFQEQVHGTTKEQESWSDSLYFFRKINDVLLLGNSQIQDSVKHIFALADSIYYCDTLSRIILQKEAAVAIQTGDSLAVLDTLYFGADFIEYHTVPRCSISEGDMDAASGRLKDILSDPVEEYRRQAAEAAAKKAEEAKKAVEESGMNEAIAASRGRMRPGQKEEKPEDEKPVAAAADTLAAATDSLAAATDSTKIGFLMAVKNVKVFRKDIQVKSDSLLYSDLDSIARFYIDPIIWNEGNRQYTADSISCLIRDGHVDRSSLMSSAFIITEEPGAMYYDQIKSAEVMAYFDTATALTRFDALGGVNALFYLKEKETIGTVNKVESKMLSARFKNAEMDRVYYFDAPKNDAYPVVQLPKEEQKMKGFRWQNEMRPKSGRDITSLRIRPSQRQEYAMRERGDFQETDYYFPGYMNSVYSAIATRDSLKAVQKLERERLERERQDSLAREEKLKPIRDSLARIDSLARADSIAKLSVIKAVKDSVEVKDSADVKTAPSDSAVAPVPSTAVKKTEPSKAEIRKAKKEEARRKREEKARAKQERKEARWKAKDEKDRAKEDARKKKALERKAARERLILKRQAIQDKKDDAKREKFRLYYEKQKARKDSKSPQKPSPSILPEPIQTSREN